MADNLLEYINEFSEEDIDLKYNKFYIGLAKEGMPSNFAVFRPRKSSINLEIKLPYSEEIQSEIESAGLDDMGYLKKWGVYRLRLTSKDLKDEKTLIVKLLQAAYQNFK